MRWLWWFLAGFIVFFAWRGGIPLIWDDSPIVAFNLYDRAPEVRWNLSGPGFWSKIFTDGFNHISRGGYRPLSEIFRNIGTAYFSNEANPFWFWLSLIAIFYGAFFLVYAAVAERMQISRWWAAFGLLLFFTSPAQLGASWVLFAGIQILVPLLILCELLIYLRFLTERITVGPVVLLCAYFIFAPWWREFTGVGPVLIGAWELMHRRRWKIFALSGLGLLLAVFPTWIGFLFWPETVAGKGVFKIGSLGDHVSFFELRTQIFPVLYLFYSSFFWLTLLISLVVLLKKDGKWFHGLTSKSETFLFLFFAIAFLPFLHVYTSPVHLAYCIVPLSLLSASVISRGWQYSGRRVRVVFAVLIAFAVGEQLLTAYASHESTRGILLASRNVGEWLKEKTPAKSIVLSNALHGEDIRLSQHGHNRFFYTMGAGVNDLNSIVDTPEKLKTWLEQNFKENKIYLLATEFEYTPDKVGYHSHHFLRKNCLDADLVHKMPGVQFVYPFLDPLKRRVTRSLIVFPSSPDLENDFYRGPARDGSRWRRELSNEYLVYEVKSSAVNCL